MDLEESASGYDGILGVDKSVRGLVHLASDWYQSTTNGLIYLDRTEAYETLELGAGSGLFSKALNEWLAAHSLAQSYTTDAESHPPIDYTAIHPGFEVDVYCDAHKLPWRGGRFKYIVAANPYNFGFRSPGESRKLLTSILKVAKADTHIFILSSSSNGYGAYRMVKRHLEGLLDTDEKKQQFGVLSYRLRKKELPEWISEVPFLHADGITPAKPDHCTVLTIKKQ